jgi:hypothetical protein
MDDEKSITEKLTDAISKAAGSVKSAMSHVVDTASDAAQHAMEANAEKISRIPAAKPGPEQVAGTTNEQIYIPQASDAAAMPMPLFPVAPAPKKKPPSRLSRAKTAPAKAKAAPGKTVKKTAKRPAKKKASANKPATKSAKKAAKKSTGKKTKKAAKKSSVRSSKKARRKSGK